MKCKNCGNSQDVNEQYCSGCGQEYPGQVKSALPKEATPVEPKTVSGEVDKPINQYKPKAKPAQTKVRLIKLAIGLVVMIGLGVYGAMDDRAIETNNQGLDSFIAGDNLTAIEQLEKAKEDALSEDAKLSIALNLAYVYTSEEMYEEALETFREALAYADDDSLEHYLISGEIQYYDGWYAEAEQYFLQAHEKDPEDYQVNNSLALFYLDLDDVAPEFVDYPKALEHARKAYEVGGKDLENITKMNLAVAHFFNDNYGETVSLLADFDYSQHPYAAFWSSLAYWARGDIDNAKKYLQISIDNGAEVPEEVYTGIMDDSPSAES